MGIGNKLADRYEVKKTLGQGGMGVVYWAYDTLIRRDVALKTIRDVPEPAALELFHEECNILASISHPNIIEIFDVGKFKDDEGTEKPYFVMPLLKGATFSSLLQGAGRRLSVERIIGILCQTCRGLQAAHEHGLVHRDLKPSNIFVLEDDSVKIIDFGVAHMADALTASAPMGTLFYMSPEQIELKPATALSDIFTLGVVAYEALTSRRPFDGPTHRDIAHAILHKVAPPASDLNVDVSPLISRVVHKTMAKQPRNRFSSARDLAEALQKALRDDPIEAFDSAKVQARLDRVVKAFEAGDYQFASEILMELESDGHAEPEMAPLRQKIDETIRQNALAQLLESAKTRITDEEYSLALEKIQEALELDPTNAEAIRMKANIESNRSTPEVDGSLVLARQYLEKRAFSHARKAVETVLQRQPSDARARGLLDEIQRTEQQYAQVRQGKEKLYQAAMEAHANGELTVAIAKLDAMLELDKSAPEISRADRSIAFWRFYDQVRSECDANLAVCAEARRYLNEGNFNRAMEVGAAALNKYPAEPATQAMKADMESRKRQDLSALVATVDRMVELEPDLDQRIELLSRAAGQYPGEPHFSQALQRTREKRELVKSLAAKALEHEEQSQFSEALEQLEILRTVHSQYPGLEFEMARISKRRSQQKRKDNKVRWARQLEHSEDGSSFGSLFEDRHELPHENRASQTAISTPDPMLSEQGASVAAEQAEGLCAGAHALQTKAKDLYAQGNFEEAASHLRLAYQLDDKDVDVRSALVDTLVEHARSLPESSRDHASELVHSALALDPGHAEARSMAVLIGAPSAIEYTDRGQAAVEPAPVEPAAAEHAEVVHAEVNHAESRHEAADYWEAEHPAAVLEHRRVEFAPSETEIGETEQVETAPAEAEFLAEGAIDEDSTHELWESPAARTLAESTGEEASAPAPVATLDLAFAAAASSAPSSPPSSAPSKASPPTTTLPPVEAPASYLPSFAQLPPAPPAESEPSQTNSWPKWIGYGGVAAVLAAFVVALLFRHSPPTPKQDQAAVHNQAVGPLFPVDVRTVPDGATILVNDKVSGTSNLQLKLPAGTYRINVAMDGYQAQQTSVTVPASQGATADVVLQPLPSTLRLLTDFGGVSVTLDSHRQNDVRNGQLILDHVGGGAHTVGIRSGPSRATIHFNTRLGAMPMVTNIEIGRASNVILIANVGHRAKIYSSQKTGEVSVDGKAAGALNHMGVELRDLGAGDHEIDIVQDDEHRKVIYETATAPTLTIYLNNQASDKEARAGNGSLVVVTGEDNVKVSVDGKLQRSTTRHGQLRISNLAETEHVVSVSKDGFQSPPEQRVTLKNSGKSGQAAKLTFELHPVSNGSAAAALHMAKAMPGIQVLIDGKLSGTVDQDGNFPVVQVAPGSHRVMLRKDEYKSKTFELSFSGGQDSTLSGSDVVLEATFGFLKVSTNPASAQVTVQRSGDAPHPLTSSSQRLPEGSYTVTATAPHYITQFANVEISGGSTKNLTLQLSPEAEHVTTAPKAVSVGMAGWQQSAGWQPDGKNFKRRGGNLTLFKPQGAGTYTFSASMKHGKQLKWVAHVVNSKNYVEFELDDEYFYRRQMVDGKSKELIKKKHGLEMPLTVGATVQMTVGPSGITQRIKTPGGWTVLDSWQRPYLAEGSVGFLIPHKDEVELSGFSFTGNE